MVLSNVALVSERLLVFVMVIGLSVVLVMSIGPPGVNVTFVSVTLPAALFVTFAECWYELSEGTSASSTLIASRSVFTLEVFVVLCCIPVALYEVVIEGVVSSMTVTFDV